MSDDLTRRLEALRGEVARVELRSPADVRARGDRRTRHQATGVTLAGVAAIAVVGWGGFQATTPQSDIAPAPAPVTSMTSSPSPSPTPSVSRLSTPTTTPSPSTTPVPVLLDEVVLLPPSAVPSANDQPWRGSSTVADPGDSAGLLPVCSGATMRNIDPVQVLLRYYHNNTVYDAQQAVTGFASAAEAAPSYAQLQGRCASKTADVFELPGLPAGAVGFVARRDPGPGARRGSAGHLDGAVLLDNVIVTIRLEAPWVPRDVADAEFVAALRQAVQQVVDAG